MRSLKSYIFSTETPRYELCHPTLTPIHTYKYVHQERDKLATSTSSYKACNTNNIWESAPDYAKWPLLTAWSLPLAEQAHGYSQPPTHYKSLTSEDLTSVAARNGAIMASLAIETAHWTSKFCLEKRRETRKSILVPSGPKALSNFFWSLAALGRRASCSCS